MMVIVEMAKRLGMRRLVLASNSIFLTQQLVWDDGDCGNGEETWNAATCTCEQINVPDPTTCVDDGDCGNGEETWNAATCTCEQINVPDPSTCVDDGDCTNGFEAWDISTCSCITTPPVLGCTNSTANNYDPLATCDDGSCTFDCPDPGNCDDGICANGDETWDGTICDCVDGTPPTPCMDDGDCTNGFEVWNVNTCICDVTPPVNGCTDPTANNYNSLATCDDGSCTYDCPDPGNCDDGICANGDETWDASICDCVDGTPPTPCMDDGDCTNGFEVWNANTCICDVTPPVSGCTDPTANNYDPLATCDDGSCTYDCPDPGNCDDGICANGDETWDASICDCVDGTPPPPCMDDGDCTNGFEVWNPNTCICDVTPPLSGCTDPTANNYDPLATCDDGSCIYNCPDPGDCDDGDCSNGEESWNANICQCVPGIPPFAETCDDGDCSNGEEMWDTNICDCITIPTVTGCTNPAAENYDPLATCDDGSCDFSVIASANTELIPCDATTLLGSITITITEGTAPFTYTLTGNTQGPLPGGIIGALNEPFSIDDLPIDYYTVQITSADGGVTYVPVSIAQQVCILVANVEGKTIPCGTPSGSISIVVTSGVPPFNYTWSGNSQGPLSSGTINDLFETITINGLIPDIYLIEITSADGSMQTYDGIGITLGEQMEVEATATSDFDGFQVSCNGASDGSASVNVTLNGVEPFTYLWSNGDTLQTIENLEANSYFVTVTDSNGCEAVGSVLLEEQISMSFEYMTQSVSCFGDNDGSIMVLDVDGGGTAPYLYSLNGSDFEEFGFYGNLLAGTYDVLIQDANGCEAVQSIIVEQPSELVVDLGADFEIQLGDEVTITALINEDTSLLDFWQWERGLFLEDSCTFCLDRLIAPMETTLYSFMVGDTTGCVGQDELLITVRKDRGVFIPNGFSPNGDGYNDYFFINTAQEVTRIKSLRVFTRWGEIVYDRTNVPLNDPEAGWNGMLDGKEMNPGVFIFIADIEFVDGREEMCYWGCNPL